MSEKRRHKRYAKRLTVRFGQKDLTSTAFLVDISAGGMFVAANSLPDLRTRLHLQVQLEAGKSLYFEGIVQRHKQVPPELRSVARGGFGVRFLRPEELLGELVPKSQESSEKLAISFRAQADLKSIYDKEIRAGGLFVQTERKFERDAAVTLQLKLGWAERVLEFNTKVVHVTEAAAKGPQGVALIFTEIRKAQDAISAYL